MAPDFSPWHRTYGDLRHALKRANLLGGTDIHVTLFPLSHSLLPNFFDYSHVLAVAFDLDDKVSFRSELEKDEPVTLTVKEREVLKGARALPGAERQGPFRTRQGLPPGRLEDAPGIPRDRSPSDRADPERPRPGLRPPSLPPPTPMPSSSEPRAATSISRSSGSVSPRTRSSEAGSRRNRRSTWASRARRRS